MAVQLARRSFNVDDYYRMAEAGILTEDDRLELIEGEILRMSPIGIRHAAGVNFLSEWLVLQSQGEWVVSVQNPLRLSDHTEPEPDLMLLKRRADFYRRNHPGPEDVLLIIEVSDSSLEYDRAVKLPIYVRAGIPEIWLVNLIQDRIEVYSHPAEGGYGTVQVFERGEIAASVTIPRLRISVDALFV